MCIFDWFNTDVAGVYGIYGLLGGGKTMTAVEIAKYFLKYNHYVCSNVRLKNGLDEYERYRFIPDMDLVNWWELPQGAPRGSGNPLKSCIILDECAEWFNQFSSNSPIVQNFLSWLRHSSKRGQYVFLIVQKPEFLVKSLRLLVAYWICCVDYNTWRFPIIRCRIPFLGCYVDRRLFDSRGNLVSRGLCLADKRDIGRYYDTAQILSSDTSHNGAVNNEYDGIFSLDRSRVFLYASALFWCCFLWSVFHK